MMMTSDIWSNQLDVHWRMEVELSVKQKKNKNNK